MAILDTSVTGSIVNDRDDNVFIGIELPFYKSDGSSDPINITNSKFPFFKADGSASDIGVT